MFEGLEFDVPSTITLSETIFSQMNIFVSILLLIVIPTFLFYLGKKEHRKKIHIITQETKKKKKIYRSRKNRSL